MADGSVSEDGIKSINKGFEGGASTGESDNDNDDSGDDGDCCCAGSGWK